MTLSSLEIKIFTVRVYQKTEICFEWKTKACLYILTLNVKYSLRWLNVTTPFYVTLSWFYSKYLYCIYLGWFYSQPKVGLWQETPEWRESPFLRRRGASVRLGHDEGLRQPAGEGWNPVVSLNVHSLAYFFCSLDNLSVQAVNNEAHSLDAKYLTRVQTIFSSLRDLGRKRPRYYT
jgi:hypothetical protein